MNFICQVERAEPERIMLSNTAILWLNWVSTVRSLDSLDVLLSFANGPSFHRRQYGKKNIRRQSFLQHG